MIFLLLTIATAHLFKQDSKVQQLSGTSLDMLIDKHQQFLLLLYAPWCGHCKQILPTLDNIADTTNYTIVAIDCTQHTDVRARFQVKGYPTILQIQNNTMSQFKAQRTEENLIQFLQNGVVDGIAIPVAQPFYSETVQSYRHPYIIAAVVVLLVLSIVLIWVCISDRRENKKLDELEKQLNEQKKEQ